MFVLVPAIISILNLLFAGVLDVNAQWEDEDAGPSSISLSDPNLKSQVVFKEDIKFEGNSLSPISSMAILSPDEILLLEKNTGEVRKIINGTMLDEPLIDVAIGNELERGMLGIAVAVNGSQEYETNTNVYLYFTKSLPSEDGKDKCSPSSHCVFGHEPVGNTLYKYELRNDMLINPRLLLDLPAGARHNGGALIIGPDNYIYITIGDLRGDKKTGPTTRAQNYQNGTEPDGRAGILRITQDGETVGGSGALENKGILGDTHPLNKYYAYGIRNSFGIDFDPVSGRLWDTENGDSHNDEINLVEPGFNSGWNKVLGLSSQASSNEKFDPTLDLVDFDGNGKYSSPEFIWNDAVGPTALKFYGSDKLGKLYENDMFVGDVNNGNLYHFELNEDRDALKLDWTLRDRIANSSKELGETIFAEGFGVITDIEVGPQDGYLYVLSHKNDQVTITRILPSSNQFFSNIPGIQREKSPAVLHPQPCG